MGHHGFRGWGTDFTNGRGKAIKAMRDIGEYP
jgi:hypothetical protein